jgi:hypothetical protein
MRAFFLSGLEVLSSGAATMSAAASGTTSGRDGVGWHYGVGADGRAACKAAAVLSEQQEPRAPLSQGK